MVVGKVIVKFKFFDRVHHAHNKRQGCRKIWRYGGAHTFVGTGFTSLPKKSEGEPHAPSAPTELPQFRHPCKIDPGPAQPGARA
jgi:hypothetical protein